jgi:hypothetical protein
MLGAASYGIYHPYAADEFTPLFQSRIFAAGRLVGHFPTDLIDRLIPADHQNTFLMVSKTTGETFGVYWPGFALLLTPFTALGVPWLCNPLVAGGTLLLIGQIATELLEDEEARGWAMLLTLASPVFTMYAISLFSMNCHLFVNLLYVYFLLKPSKWRLVAAGFVGSWALVLHNPYPHLLFAIPWLARLAWCDRRLSNLLLIALGYLPISLLCGIGWVLLKRSLILQDLSLEHLSATDISPSADEALPLARLFVLPTFPVVFFRIAGLAKSIIWEVPGLLVLAVLGLKRRPRIPALKVMGASVLLTFLGYFFFPLVQGYGWGNRYFHSAWGLMPLLGAAAIFSKGADDQDLRRLRSLVGFLAIFSLILATSLRLYQAHQFVREVQVIFPPYDLRTPQVIFVDVTGAPYAADFVQNDPFLRDPALVFVSYGDQADEELIRQRFPWATLKGRYPLGTIWRPAGTGPVTIHPQ